MESKHIYQYSFCKDSTHYKFYMAEQYSTTLTKLDDIYQALNSLYNNDNYTLYAC